MASSIAVPGQLLGPADKYTAGPGTHVHKSNLYSSLLGTITIHQPERAPGPSKRLTKIAALASVKPTLPTVSVSCSGISERREVLPEVNDVVLCRVTRITPRHATVAIMAVGNTVFETEWQGIIRVQDVRATEKDRVKIYESFRPGDIVRAQVVSSSIRGLCGRRGLIAT
jgi:exosome complex component CSL4